MIFEVAGYLITEWIPVTEPVSEMKKFSTQDELGEYFMRLFMGQDGFTAKVKPAGLDQTPFASTPDYCELWEQFDDEGDVSISDDSDGFKLDEVDFQELANFSESDTFELNVKYYAGFHVSVEADSIDQAKSLVMQLGPKLLFIEDTNENEWDVDSIEIQDVAPIEQE